jgi:hypothetical protein
MHCAKREGEGRALQLFAMRYQPQCLRIVFLASGLLMSLVVPIPTMKSLSIRVMPKETFHGSLLYLVTNSVIGSPRKEL